MKPKKVALYGMLACLALILGYVEAQLPVFFMVPGMKLGLTNVVVVVALYRMGYKDAWIVNLLRMVLTAFLFTNLFSLAYSLAGALCSFLVMSLLKKTGRFSVMGVSAAGGVCHNIGQILVAALLMTQAVFSYLPILLVTGLVTGLLIGVLGALLIKHLPTSVM